MEQKYLPIGSVCTLKGKNKKVMVTGYYSVEFSGNLRINDYVGYAYPEGMLLPESFCTFNHTDIENIDFIGFKNEEQRTFDGLLNRLTGNDITEEEKAAKFHQENDMFLTSNSTYSKLLFDENGVVMIADPVIIQPKQQEENIFENITFDDKGYVVGVETKEDISNPFYKAYDNVEIQEQKDSSDWNIFNKIEFDEDGTVVNVERENDNNSTLNEIKFDENGIVISANGETLKEEQNYNKYKFDENGVVLSVEDENNNTSPINEIKFNEDGIVISADGQTLEEEQSSNKYKFNEDGTVVSVEDENNNSSPINEIKFNEDGIVISVDGQTLEEEQSSNKYKFDEDGTVISVEDEK